jgi:hypothetical protein
MREAHGVLDAAARHAARRHALAEVVPAALAKLGFSESSEPELEVA